MAEWARMFGAYELLKPLGSGSSSDVFLARPSNPGLGVPTPVVIKRLHGELATEDALYRRLQHEARITAALASRHLPRLYEVGRVGDIAYLALEYLSGWTVARLIQDLKGAGKQASIASAAEVALGALEALAELHGARDRTTGAPLGIVHRDIAPKNVMLGEDGVTRLIDLGLGKSRLQEWQTATGVVLGTPGYMSPEQVAAGEVDHRSDLYALGVVLWELLTLRTYIRRGPVPLMLRAQAEPVFQPPSAYRADVPAALDEVLRVALAPSRDQRFRSATEFRDALRATLPPTDELAPLPTLVGEMLWGELQEDKSQITQLLARPGDRSAANGPELAPAQLSAQLAPAHGPVPHGPVSAAGYGGADASAAPPAPERAGPVPAAFPRAPSPPRATPGLSPRLVGLLLLVTLALGVSLGAVLSLDARRTRLETGARERHDAAEVRRPLVAPTAVPSAAQEGVAPLGDEPRPGGDAEAPEARARESGVARTEPAGGANTARTPQATRAAPPAQGQRPEATVGASPGGEPTLPSGEARTRRLLARAQALRARLPGDSPAAAGATSLMSKLLMEASSPNNEGQGGRLDLLEAELGRLELEER